METDPIQVSRNIKSCRKKFGKTQEIVAGELNITKQTYINIENNPMNYSINKLNAIAVTIGCNIDDFFLKKAFTKSEKRDVSIEEKS